MILLDLGVHRAGVNHRFVRLPREVSFQCHSALVAASRKVLLYLGMHGTGIFSNFGFGSVRHSAFVIALVTRVSFCFCGVPFGSSVLTRVCLELLFAMRGAEVKRLPIMNTSRRCGRGMNLHAANRIAKCCCFHKAIIMITSLIPPARRCKPKNYSECAQKGQENHAHDLETRWEPSVSTCWLVEDRIRFPTVELEVEHRHRLITAQSRD